MILTTLKNRPEQPERPLHNGKGNKRPMKLFGV